MMQPMDTIFQTYMMNAALRTAFMMFKDMIRATITRDKDRLTEALGHEPTQENWEDYWQLLGEQASKQKACQREADREKLRRLVMGDTDVAT